MVKQNNLKLSTVTKMSKQMDQTEVYIIEDGVYAGQQITFQPIFDDIAIEELLTEYNQLLNEADEKGIEISKQLQFPLIYMLTIKYFTHFKKDIPSSLLGEGKKVGLLDTLEHFRKTGLLSECLNRIFSPVEVNKIFNKMTDVAATGLLSVDLDNQMFEKMEQLKIANKDVFEQLGNIDTENKVVQ